MEKWKEASRLYKAIKKYYNYLRICAFNDAKASTESRTLECIQVVLDSKYKEIKRSFGFRKPLLDFRSHKIKGVEPEIPLALADGLNG